MKEFPCRHQHREIPRHHRADNANGLTGDQRQSILGGRGDLVIDLVRAFRIPLQRLQHDIDVDEAALGDRLAHVDGLKNRQLIHVFLK